MAASEGIVVVEVTPGLAGEAAGLRAGDVLHQWTAPPARGILASPFDVRELEVEQGPRGPVRLAGRRGDEPLEASLFPDDWGVDVRPALPPELVAMHQEARRLSAAGHHEAAVARLREMSTRLNGAPLHARAWARVEVARAERARRRADAIGAALREAAELARGAGDRLLQAQLLERLGGDLYDLERFEEAWTVLAAVRDLRPPGGPPSLARAAFAERLTSVAYMRGKGMEETRPALKEALDLQERLAPRSLALVRTIHALGPVIESEGEARLLFERAHELLKALAPDGLLAAKTLQLLASVNTEPPRKLELARQALAIRERKAPESLEVAASLRQIGIFLNQVGQTGPAEQHLLRALALQEKLGPDTQQHGRMLNGLAILAKDRGDLAGSESYFRRYLALTERTQPDSIWLAIGFSNFAQLLQDRREFDEAESYLARGWRIVEREAPKSDVAAYLLTTRGIVARGRGDAGAESYLARAEAVLRETDPRNVLVAYILQERGDLAKERGRFDDAQALYELALESAVQRAPASASAANAYESLGALAFQRGQLEAAEKHHRQALDLRRDVVPDSIWEAESSHSLGMVFRRTGRTAESLELLQRAVTALEAQARRLGGTAEVRAHFRAHYAEYYRDLEELLIEMGRPDEAFATVERSRARALLALLAARDVRFERDAPADLEAARRAADADYDRVLRRLSAPRAPLSDAARARLREDLEQARRQQDEVRAQIRAAAPRLAAVRDPEPLALAGVRRALPAGALLLAFSLGPGSSRVYAVGPGPDEFVVRDLGATEAEVRRAVEALRERIEKTRGALGRAALLEQADRLGALLLGPVAPQLARADRLLVMPDGVLHVLPMAALRHGRRHLVESHSVQVVPSITLHTLLARPSALRAAADSVVVGFGDPAYPAGARAGGNGAAGSGLRSSLAERLRLDPLPAGRRELEALAALSPGAARLWLGADATEARAKAVGREARIVHFATHGFADEDLPLESGLALSVPVPWREGEDNGLLQAWEVFEQLRLDADLVTLSACETGLGREVVGEGLLGLLWAFQYAGARTVLASLWSVNDEATGELMRRFYAGLRGGRPKAEALRRAQLELLRSGRSSPFFWASFQLVGAWD